MISGTRDLRGPRECLRKALRYLMAAQGSRGDWEGEVVWCPILLAQRVLLQALLGRSFDKARRDRMVLHFQVTRTEEGGWGLHRESRPYVYVTTLAYVALRLLGVDPEDTLTAPARAWLRSQPGGVLSIPSWGKFWLAMLGLYEYEGVNPCPPEMFLLPAWIPFHPARFYCHTRYIYLGIGFLSGRRFQANIGPIRDQLRSELYNTPYSSIQFRKHRHDLAPGDVYVRPSTWLRIVYDALSLYDCFRPPNWRRRALDYCFERILYEQRASRYQAISPVNGMLNCLAIWSRDPNHADLEPSLEGVESWRWDDETEGTRYAGARSNTWDTAFVSQAFLEWLPAAGAVAESMRRAYRFLAGAQLLSELEGYRSEFRDPALGGWCFSDGWHRWPVSDCTAEALCALLKIQESPGMIPDGQRVSEERLRLAAEFILYRQNADGGFGTYERGRGSLLLENVNPSEMFGSCMTELSYIECTGSSVRALARLRQSHPHLADDRISQGIERGIRFLRSQQLADGSFPGFWGINFTYATLFVVDALRAAGVPAHDRALRRAAEWLTGKQRADGGWGEHYSSCLRNAYVEHSESQPVMTAWALLSLIELLGPDADTVRRGIDWLCSQQEAGGSWRPKAVNGVFFGSAMLDYRLYHQYFPAWALARYAAAATSAP